MADWLSFAGTALSTAAGLTDKLVTSGQQNRTNREITIAETQAETEKYKANTQLIGFVVIGFIAIILMKSLLKK